MGIFHRPDFDMIPVRGPDAYVEHPNPNVYQFSVDTQVSMKTQLSLFDRQLQLHRYPPQHQNETLQAWDSTDEYLIEHITSEWDPQELTGMQILNDEFGALSCWFSSAKPGSYGDSFVSNKGCKYNAQQNQIDSEQITLGHSMHSLQPARLYILKIPKTTALLEHQLIQIQSVAEAGCKVIAAGKAKMIHKSTLALFEKYLGPVTTSLAKKKSRLIFCTPDGNKQHQSPYPTRWQLDNSPLQISNHANVFSRQQLDIGARFMLEHLPDASNKTLVDLGCGNGVLGLSVLQQNPSAKVIFIDESYMAIQSARENVEENLPHLLDQCEFIVSNCLEELGNRKVNIVLCNPPFHQQNTITDHIAWQMFSDSAKHLYPGGELRIVGNRHLDYPAKLKRLFGGYQVEASNKKFSILSSKKSNN